MTKSDLCSWSVLGQENRFLDVILSSVRAGALMRGEESVLPKNKRGAILLALAEVQEKVLDRDVLLQDVLSMLRSSQEVRSSAEGQRGRSAVAFLDNLENKKISSEKE